MGVSSSTNKADRHDIAEILLKVALSTIKPTNHWKLFTCSLYSNLTPQLFIEVPVPSQKSDRSCICVLGVSIFPFLQFLLLWKCSENVVFLFYFFLFPILLKPK
jgi:hypothetical protein